MSTASADTSSDQPQRTSLQPGPLAILAATAIGGVLATRMGKTPFLLAAGAAAIALLNQKKGAAPAPLPQSLPPPAPPAPELDLPARSQVEQWLSRQILREEQAPVIEISSTDVTPDEQEEDYHPESFLLDDADEFSSAPPDNDFLASLSEPVPQPVPEPAFEMEPKTPLPPPPVLETFVPDTFLAPSAVFPPSAVFAPSIAPSPSAVFQPSADPAPSTVFAPSIDSGPSTVFQPSADLAPSAIFAPSIALAPSAVFTPSAASAPSAAPPPALAADSAWTLGVEPMPSLNEGVPYVAPAGSLFFSTPVRQEAPARAPEPPRSNMFSSAPVQHEDPGPPLFFSNSVFEGGAFPDEISVAPPPEPVSPPAESPPADAAVPAPEPARVNEAAAVEPTQEIHVEFAAPGEASFDPPLAAAPPNPWQPAPEDFAIPPAFSSFPSQTQSASTVVEAEIILRPRAPTQNTVTAKSKFAPPTFSKHSPGESNEPPPAEGTNDAHFPGPLPSPHEPKSRPTWRSWWRGD